jgi:hypothetical protein
MISNQKILKISNSDMQARDNEEDRLNNLLGLLEDNTDTLSQDKEEDNTDTLSQMSHVTAIIKGRSRYGCITPEYAHALRQTLVEPMSVLRRENVVDNNNKTYFTPIEFHYMRDLNNNRDVLGFGHFIKCGATILERITDTGVRKYTIHDTPAVLSGISNRFPRNYAGFMKNGMVQVNTR